MGVLYLGGGPITTPQERRYGKMKCFQGGEAFYLQERGKGEVADPNKARRSDRDTPRGKIGDQGKVSPPGAGQRSEVLS